MEYVENRRVDIKDVKDVSSLLAYFHCHLNWDLGLESFEDVEDYLYDFSADDLGLKQEEFAKIKSLRQLPPVNDAQQWGIFCVEFDTERFYVTALRKILSCLVPKARNATKHAVWNEQDLLFLCFWGTGNNRTICIAHFEQKENGLSIVRTIHCAPAAEDPIILGKFTKRLERLEWPLQPSDYEGWHSLWTSAFTVAYGEVIKTSKVLAERMAEVAGEIRDTIIEAMEVETANGFAHLLFDKVKHTLVHDLTVKDFASMYAQTIVYGLFSARCLDKTPEDFSVEEAIGLIPSTDPFLKGLMKECLGVRRGGLSFDELGIGDVVEMFAHVDAAKIADDFGRRSGGGREDPVIYFYEDFLKAYDKQQKVKCGEFYTPQPVVGFMVRAVDYILKTHFNLPDGLATDATKKVKYIPEGKKSFKEKDAPAIQILDPATGTGTFIREIILRIFETFKQNYAKTGGPQSSAAFTEAWSRYVDRNVLPRLNAFELMMAPYAIAHMKLAMVLQDTGYDFKGDKRLQVYLTNSLEEPGSSDKQMMLFDDDPLAAESVEANRVKKNAGINIVIGNPPYSGVSQNNGPECKWIDKLVDEYKFIDGVSINEQKLRIRNDYIKFLRYGQNVISNSASGVLSFINPHAYLDGPTFRAMRWNLMKEFDSIYILNLHGDVKKKEKAPDGGPDQNVFEIKEGVVINIFVKTGKKKHKSLADVFYYDVFGDQDFKCKFLAGHGLQQITWQTLCPVPKFYEFLPRVLEVSDKDQYQEGFSICEIMPICSTGVQTSRDQLAVAESSAKLSERMRLFCNPKVEDGYINDMVGGIDDSSFWTLREARTALQGRFNLNKILPYLYRPFDRIVIYYDKEIVHRQRSKVFGNFMFGLNKALIIGRQGLAVGDIEWNLVYATTGITDLNIFYRGGGCTFPLYRYEEYHGKMQKVPNLNPEIVKKITTEFGEEPTPEDIFNYIYAVLHSPSYRKKYKEFLKIDFPRIPYPTDAATFHALAALGAQLVAIHTMKDFDEADDVAFEDAGGREVGKVSWKDGAVYINKESRFTGVEEATFNQYIGGYQPLQKWLKDRKGRTLSDADVSHYKRIVRALRRTAALMSEIDELPLIGE